MKEKLAAFTKLTVLRPGDPMTDAEAEELITLRELVELHLCDPKVTNEGVGRLQVALPRCKIYLHKWPLSGVADLVDGEQTVKPFDSCVVRVEARLPV